MSSPRKHSSERRSAAIDGDLWDVAVKIARQRVSGRPWLRAEAEDLASHALMKLHAASRRTEIDNPEAYISRVIRNRVVDLAIKRDAEARQLVLAHDELPVQKLAKGGSAPVEARRRGEPVRGLSLEVINKEERDMANLHAAAVLAVMPDEWDRKVLADRIYGDSSMSITDLARQYGKTPNVMANYLAGVLGSAGKPGAVVAVRTLLNELSVRQATALVRVLVDHADDLDVLSDPFASALGHLELAATYSSQHRRDAKLAIARLNWLRGHFPNNRGMPNKILRRLVAAACLYVVEQDDANNDRFDRGLVDDVAVLKASVVTVQRHSR